jgi:adenylate cyclase
MTNENEPSHEAIRTQTERILRSARFRGSEKQKGFLSFVVNEALAGRGSQLKGYTVALAVYGRKESFDPQVDPIVRVEAGRLRRALEHYYLTEGKDIPIRIEIPKGGYVPTFQAVRMSPPAAETPAPELDNRNLITKPSLAVMPLLNLTGDDEQDYFADGLTEELTAELARYQEIQVIASQSTLRFKGRKVDPKDAGRALGVRFLLAGSIRKDLKTIKIAIRLLDTSTAEQIWGESYKRELTAAHLIELQEEISQRVVGAVADQYGLITRKLSKDSRKKSPTDLKAYDAILRFYQYETVLTPEAFNQALEALTEAVKIEPGYGLAWAMLGHLHADNHALGFCEIDATLEKALAFAQKGVALEPENQFAQDALTLVHFHRSDKASFLKHVDETIALNPNAPYIIGVAGWHLALYGEWDRGLTLLQRGKQLNPYYPQWFHLAPFMNYYRRGEYEEAYAEALKFNYPDLFWDPLMRSAALGQMKRDGEATSALAELLVLEPDFAAKERKMIGSYVKVDGLIDKVIEGLQKAGLDDFEFS